MYYVYILTCKDGTLYTGSTSDIIKRLYQHNNLKSGAHYTKIRRPVVLSYHETYNTYKEARAREAEIKRLRKEDKEMLMKNTQPKSV